MCRAGWDWKSGDKVGDVLSDKHECRFGDHFGSNVSLV